MIDTGLLHAPRPIYVADCDVEAAAELRVPPEYPSARVLFKRGPRPVGLATLAVRDGRLDADALRTALAALPTDGGPAPESGDAVALPSIAVAIPTHDRPDMLRRALASILRSPVPSEILVVDNAPSDDRTRQAVQELAAQDSRIRYLVEPRVGASSARNRALREGTADVIAFTDDDVEVDSEWVAAHQRGYRDPSVSCVTGPAFAARLDNREEVLCEVTIGWSKGFTPQRYDIRRPPKDSGLFPFSPGLFGGGMNFSVRRKDALALGGLDPTLGAGVPTKGSEDGDFFVRLVRSGRVLAYEPAAYIHHYHRSDAQSYEKQRDGYSVGLGAYMAKLALNPRNWLAIARRVPAVARQQSEARLPVDPEIPRGKFLMHERLMLKGAWLYAKAQLPRR